MGTERSETRWFEPTIAVISLNTLAMVIINAILNTNSEVNGRFSIMGFSFCFNLVLAFLVFVAFGPFDFSTLSISRLVKSIVWFLVCFAGGFGYLCLGIDLLKIFR